jgi:hypothetical protein
MENKFRLLAGSLLVAVMLTIGISAAVFAAPGDEDGSYGSGYCQANCLGTGNGGNAVGPRYGGRSCH